MFFAYIDDSGDVTARDTPVRAGERHTGSLTYTLGCLLVAANSWPRIHDSLIDLRRELKSNFGVPIRAELKANFILRNKGLFYKLGLSEKARRRIYELCMVRQDNLGTKTFAIVIDKTKLAARDQERNPREVAWEFLLQRIERLGTKTSSPTVIFHDEGEEATIRKLARKARRAGVAGSAYGTGWLSRPATYLIEDPVARDSIHSYFVQLADLNAYAAFRRVFPPPADVRVQIVPQNTWDKLGTSRFRPANQLKGGVPGIVVWPR